VAGSYEHGTETTVSIKSLSRRILLSGVGWLVGRLVTNLLICVICLYYNVSFFSNFVIDCGLHKQVGSHIACSDPKS
jgi:hypothetical protein